MTLGDIIMEVVKKDLAGGHKLSIKYEEKIEEGKFKIKLLSESDKEAFIHCAVPYDGLEATENYARAYFLSMVFNAAIYGVKREKKLVNREKKSGNSN